MDIRQHATSLTIRDIDPDKQLEIVQLLQSHYGFTHALPALPTWDNWSPKIPITAKAKDVPNQKDYVTSGCYKVWYDDEVIYIGETRTQKGEGTGRPGMWARRADFRSTILGKNIQNPYGNATRFVQEFGDNIERVYHTFHYVHPMYCKQAEEELLREYYKLHGKLPLLQSEIDYKRIK